MRAETNDKRRRNFCLTLAVHIDPIQNRIVIAHVRSFQGTSAPCRLERAPSECGRLRVGLLSTNQRRHRARPIRYASGRHRGQKRPSIRPASESDPSGFFAISLRTIVAISAGKSGRIR